MSLSIEHGGLDAQLGVRHYEPAPDSASSSAKAEVILGTEGDDQLFGTDNADLIKGLGGADVIYANGGDDTVYGGDGDDFIKAGPGDDVIFGGAGFDRVSFYGAPGGIHVDLTIKVAQDTGWGMDKLSQVEDVSGTPTDDIIIGDKHANWLWGSEGGADSLDGGAGDDLFTVQTGDSTLVGGSGRDTVSFSSNGFGLEPALTVDLNLQGDVQDTGAGVMLLSGVENLSAAADELTDDVFIGDRFSNVLAGGAGSDILTGNKGADLLLGDGVIYAAGAAGGVITQALSGGGEGDDTLDGGAGADTLIGGAGMDTMYGGGARDVFMFLDITDCLASAPGGPGADGFTPHLDLIADFGRKDVIDLSGIDADVNTDGDQAFHLVSNFTGEAGEMRVYHAAGDGKHYQIWLDVDGDTIVDGVIHVQGAEPQQDQFVL
jgi:Ca2+-binding RTX toxin-like protein